MSKTPENAKNLEVDFEELLDNIADEKKEKSSKTWKTYKYRGFTLLLNVPKNFIKVEELGQYINNLSMFNYLFESNFQETELKKIEKKDSSEYNKEEAERVQKAVRKVNTWDKPQEPTDAKFLFKEDVRGIKKDILNFYLDRGWIKKRGKDIQFIMNSKYGLSGIYILGTDLKKNKKIQKGSIKGLVTINPKLKSAENIIIAESPIDAISFLQLNNLNPATTTILATAGTIGTATRETLQKVARALISFNKADIPIYLTFDNDSAGRRFASEVADIFTRFNVKDEVPADAKDWNDVLQYKQQFKSKSSLFAGMPDI